MQEILGGREQEKVNRVFRQHCRSDIYKKGGRKKKNWVGRVLEYSTVPKKLMESSWAKIAYWKSTMSQQKRRTLILPSAPALADSSLQEVRNPQ